MTIEIDPLQSWVDEAVNMAMRSPCLSKRGVVIGSQDMRLIGSGFNHQPFPFRCSQNDACKKNCGKTAIHAEQSAILRATAPIKGAWMLHVKAKQGKPCSSLGPSCLECSKLILESGIEWMHLLHDPRSQMLGEVVGQVEGFLADGTLGKIQIRRYSAPIFHWLTARYGHGIEVLP